jgi:N-acetylmuramoyl-L-alanine amidase
MTTRISRALISAFSVTVFAAACAPRNPAAPTPVPVPVPVTALPVPTAPAPLPPANAALPPVPHTTGPLLIKVVYPSPAQVIQSKDSNFIFGSVGNGDAALTINGVPTPVWPNGSFMGWLANPPADHPEYNLVAAAGSEVARLNLPIKLAPPPPKPDTVQLLSPAQYAALIGPATVSNDTDRVVTAYALTGGIQRWFLIPGTVVKVISIKGPDAFVALDSADTVRIARTDLNMLTTATPQTPPPVRTTKPFRIVPSTEYLDVIIPVSDRPAYLVEEGPSSLTLTFYSATGQAQPTVPAPVTTYVSSISAAPSGPQMRYTIALRGPVYGYQPLWQDSIFTLRVRRPPAIDATDPLKGLTIAIDPGHPPAGAHGPTGLYEGEAVLAVGFKVRDMLAARGVNVLMTRTTMDSVDLNLRPAMARRANAHALVSIHLNAVPDGQNPFVAEGTTTYHFWMHSQPMATAIHQALLPQLSLPDKGVKRENFALVRPTWMPAVLCEGAFVIMPDQEAALRTPEYQERYARGIVDGLDHYFRSLGSAAH